LSFLREVLAMVRRAFKTVVFVLDEMEQYTRRSKQVLLYNLLDALQAGSVQVGGAVWAGGAGRRSAWRCVSRGKGAKGGRGAAAAAAAAANLLGAQQRSAVQVGGSADSSAGWCNLQGSNGPGLTA
jgi:hypothetical protein